uniref:Polyketide synthase n=1 Tax=Peronospora matthiolae TaxID=2874970 RepID=A0AAV1TMD2_9STRA
MSSSFSYQNCVAEVDEYLSAASVSDDEPGLAFQWDENALVQFVAAANQVDTSVAMSSWLSQPRGSVTSDSIVEDMMAFLATKAGGRFGRVLLAPNSVVQFGQLCGMFAYIENDVFMRAAADAAGMSAGTPLAKIFCVTTCAVSTAVPMEFPSRENPSRRLFA